MSRAGVALGRTLFYDDTNFAKQPCGGTVVWSKPQGTVIAYDDTTQPRALRSRDTAPLDPALRVIGIGPAPLDPRSG